jgi:hypothetical protein
MLGIDQRLRAGVSHLAKARKKLTSKKVLLAGGVLALVAAGGGQAFASAGCDAVNTGAFNVNLTQPNLAGISVPGFAIGDKVTFNAAGTVPAGSGANGLIVANPQNAVFLDIANITSPQSFSIPVSAITGTTLQEAPQNQGTATLSVTVTCTPAPSGGASNGNTDSQSLRAVQLGVTRTVAAISGGAISGAVDGAIGDAFSTTGGAPITVGPSGFSMNFAAEPQTTEAARRTDQAFSALGYAGNAIAKAPPRIDRDWSLWVDVRGTGFDRNEALAETRGSQVNITAGVGYKLVPDLLVGVFSGYELFNYRVASLGGKLDGDGGTVGGYAAWRFASNWRVDGALGWSDISYGATAGTAAGSFRGSRFIGTGALIGDYRYGPYLLELSSRIYALWENENAYTDSLGTAQASRSFSEGRVATGGKVIYPWQAAGDLTISPYVGFYSDYRFSTDNALPVGIAFVGIQDGWSGRVTTGVNLASGRSGASLSLGGEIGGLGAGYEIWSAKARMNMPF